MAGEKCDTIDSKCKFNCTDHNHGICRNSSCKCRAGWEGDYCYIKSSCKDDCNKHGVCFKVIIISITNK